MRLGHLRVPFFTAGELPIRAARGRGSACTTWVNGAWKPLSLPTSTSGKPSSCSTYLWCGCCGCAWWPGNLAPAWRLHSDKQSHSTVFAHQRGGAGGTDRALVFPVMSPNIAAPVVTAAGELLQFTFSWVKGYEQHGTVGTLVTSLHVFVPQNGRLEIADMTPEVNYSTYGYGLALLAAMLIASRAHAWRTRWRWVR